MKKGLWLILALALLWPCKAMALEAELESILAHVFNGAPLRPDSSRTHARETRLVRSAGFAVAHKIYLSQYLRYLNAQASGI